MKIHKTIILIFFLCIGSFNGISQEDEFKICQLSGSKIAVFGKFYGQLIFNNGDTLGEYLLTDGSKPHHFLAVCDTQGNFLWTRHINAPTTDWGGIAYGIGLVADAQQNIYICSSFEDSIRFDASTIYYGDQASTAFIAKFDSSGNFDWWLPATEPLGSISEAFSLAIDSSGNIYAAGSYQYGDISFGTGVLSDNSYSGSIFVVRFDSSGNVAWSNQLDGGGSGNGSNHNVYDLQVNNAGDFFMSGYFGGTFSGSLNYENLSLYHNASTCDFRGFILKGDSLGNGVWLKSIEGADGFIIPTDITLTNSDRMYLSGTFFNDLSYDALPTLSADNRDHFILALDTASTAVWSLQASNGMTNIYNTSVGCAADSSGNIYSIIHKSNSVEYFPLPISTASYPSAFVKHDSNGEALCISESIKPFEDIFVSAGQSVFSISGDKGEFVPGSATDIEIQKWNSNCQVIWTSVIEHDYYYFIGIEEETEPAFLIHPNPASTSIQVVLNTDNYSSVLIQIFDTSGRLVFTDNQTGPSFEINIENLDSGIYTVQISSNETKASATKLVVSK